MAVVKITLGCLYPDIMSSHGDRGNVETILRRCEWRGIAAEVRDLRIGDRLGPDELDLILIGGGGESQQRLIAADLHKVKAAGIREAVALGAAALAIGGGYELFGRFCQPEVGAEFRGAELFDTWTIRLCPASARAPVDAGAPVHARAPIDASAPVHDDAPSHAAVPGPAVAVHSPSDDYGPIYPARAERFIGELVVRWHDTLLVGFENHSGGTYLGATAQPLGEVISGYGNNGGGSEGVILGNAVGTNLRGPCLPRNPALADFLIAAALRRRHGTTELAPLPDELEHAAHDVAIARARQAWRARRARRARFAG